MGGVLPPRPRGVVGGVVGVGVVRGRRAAVRRGVGGECSRGVTLVGGLVGLGAVLGVRVGGAAVGGGAGRSGGGQGRGEGSGGGGLSGALRRRGKAVPCGVGHGRRHPCAWARPQLCGGHQLRRSSVSMAFAGHGGSALGWPMAVGR